MPLLGDSSCGFHSAALHPAHQHCSAAADDDEDDDDNIDEDDGNNSDDNQYREGAFHFIKRILFTTTCYNHFMLIHVTKCDIIHPLLLLVTCGNLVTVKLTFVMVNI